MRELARSFAGRRTKRKLKAEPASRRWATPREAPCGCGTLLRGAASAATSRCLYGGLMKPRERRVSAWNCPQTRDTPNVPKDAVPQEKMPLSPAEDAPWPSTAVIVDHLSVIDQIEQVFKKVESSLNSRWTSINRLSLIVVTTNRHHQSLLFIKFKKKTWASLDSFGYRSYRVIVVEERKTVWQRVSFGRRSGF